MIPRIYLTGSIAIEHGEHLIRERQFPGRQGRIAFVFLAVNRHRSIHRDELLGAIWPGDAPAQTDSGLDAILSKLRGTLKSAGFAATDAGVAVSAKNQCLASVSANNAEPLLAVQHALEMIELEPFRETAYQLLMKMHAASGDRAEALRVFAKCRELLRDELGVSPSPQTEAVYLEILRAE